MTTEVIDQRGARVSGPPLPDTRRFAVVVLCVLVAAPLTLQTAWSEWRYQSPLAELALVPIVGVLLLAATTVRYPYVRSARLGRPDWILATSSMGLAGILQLWDLVQPGSYSWILRLDSLSLPLVAFAAVVLLYGVRSLVAFYPALLYLALSWPLPVAALLEVVTPAVTGLTARSVEQLIAVLPFADTVPASGSDLVVDVAGPGGHFLVQISSACSGVGGALGFAVVGLGVLCLHDGRMRDKARWLLAGLLLVLACNVVRIMALIAVGGAFGEGAALEVFHPVAGLVLLNVALGLMLVHSGRFGLRRRHLRPQPTDNPLHATVAEPQPRRHRTLRARGVALLVASLLLGFVNLQFAEASPAYRNQSLAAVRSLTTSFEAEQAFGYRVRGMGEQAWATRYFGADSRWTRFELTPSHVAPTVWVDVIDTDSLGSLRAHDVLRCYQMHGQDVLASRRVSLSSGVNVDVYAVQMSGGLWHVVSWERPIQRDGRVAHERVTLMASSIGEDFEREFDATARPLSLRGRLLAAVNAMRGGTDPNPALSANMLALADDIESAQLASRHTPAQGA